MFFLSVSIEKNLIIFNTLMDKKKSRDLDNSNPMRRSELGRKYFFLLLYLDEYYI
jgi:hypothetical protein